MAPIVLSLGSGALTAAKICPRELTYCSTLILWIGLWLAARTPVRTLSEKIYRKVIGSLMPCRSVGMRSHAQKVSHCFHTVFSLCSREVERPSVTAF